MNQIIVGMQDGKKVYWRGGIFVPDPGEAKLFPTYGKALSVLYCDLIKKEMKRSNIIDVLITSEKAYGILP